MLRVKRVAAWLGCAVSIAISTQASASTVGISDLPDQNGFGYFLDERSGRVWMDVDNFIGMSFNAVRQLLEGTNFRLAYKDELTTFVAGYEGLLGSARQDNTYPFEDVANIMGRTDTNLIMAFYDNSEESGGWIRGFALRPHQNFWSDTVVLYADPAFRFTSPNEYYGAFVVQDLSITVVPEPSALVLLLFGLAAVGATGLRKQLAALS